MESFSLADKIVHMHGTCSACVLMRVVKLPALNSLARPLPGRRAVPAAPQAPQAGHRGPAGADSRALALPRMHVLPESPHGGLADAW